MLRSQDATRSRPYGRLQCAQYCVSYTGGLINNAERRWSKFPHLSAEAFPQHFGTQGSFEKIKRTVTDFFVQECSHAVQIMILATRDPIQFGEGEKVRRPFSVGDRGQVFLV